MISFCSQLLFCLHSVSDLYSVFEGAAPTLQAALRRANEENAALKVKVKSLEEKVTLLEDDKQFLRQSLSEGQ